MATNTYVALDKVTLGSSTASVTFSSINQGYTDLVVVQSGTTTTGTGIRLRFNGDTASNYSNTILYGTGSTAGSARESSITSIRMTYESYGETTDVGIRIANVMNYSNSTTYKTVLDRGNRATSGVDAIVGLWRNTAAITSITIFGSDGNLASGSTFSLYGIANADAFAKATGGVISEDATYWYHTFGSSGTFTPKQSLSCDVLVVAGGGGGSGGGGGAGGVLAFASQTVSTATTVTVGAGGAQQANGANSQFAALTASVGGGRGGYTSNGFSGGSGGGSGTESSSGTSYTGGAATSGQGFAGGNTAGNTQGGAGGGGAGGIGANNNGTYGGGAGGAGVNTVTNWGSLSSVFAANPLGVLGFIAGGGGGGNDAANNGTPGAGGSGGGGAGNTGATAGRPGTNPGNGVASTGSGGGGIYNNYPAGSGGSGLVIVRYAK